MGRLNNLCSQFSANPEVWIWRKLGYLVPKLLWWLCRWTEMRNASSGDAMRGVMSQYVTRCRCTPRQKLRSRLNTNHSTLIQPWTSVLTPIQRSMIQSTSMYNALDHNPTSLLSVDVCCLCLCPVESQSLEVFLYCAFPVCPWPMRSSPES